jgi:syndecan 1
MLPGSPEGAAAAGNGVPVAGEREWTVGNGSVPAGGAVSAAFGGSAVGEGDGSSAVGAGGLTAGRDSSGGHGAPVVGRDGHDAAVGGRPGAGPRSSAGPERSTPDEATAPTGRHAATDRTPFRPSTSSHSPGHEGRRHRPDPETPARPGEMPDTDGLGLADLLAGALAAYRGI